VTAPPAASTRAGDRTGHTEPTGKTTAGPVTLARPKLRGTSEPLASRLLGKGGARPNALESLVIAGFVRGLSVRDVEASLSDALGPPATLSKSTVSPVCQTIKEEVAAWRQRRLDDVELDELDLDGSHGKLHPGARAEPVLVAWGLTTQGAPLLLGPAAGEAHDAWADFLASLVGRGSRSPVLGISDGAPGLLSAVQPVVLTSLRQRCLVHRARNLLAKVPTGAQAEVKAAFWQSFDDLDQPPGQAAVQEATRRAEAFADRDRSHDPAAVACRTSTLEELTTHLRFPPEHWRRIRHSNLIERTFGRPVGGPR
jgi:putative transposase